MSRSSRVRVGVTIGDPSGIGPIVTVKALKRIKGLADFFIIGSRRVLKKVCQDKGWFEGLELIDVDNVRPRGFSFGKVRAEYGRASIEYLDKALELIGQRRIDCLVTCPISKQAIRLAGFGFLGHTGYLARRTRTRHTAMMLLNDKLRFSLVTTHTPLKKVSSELTVDKIYQNILVTVAALKRWFLIKRPRIVVCGLNPHASDNGLIGREEEEIIRPAVRKTRSRLGIDIDGPLPGDTAIYKAGQKRYDCVITMYHDQALIPLKLDNFSSGVNITLGLPFVRTSPLHGTAFDIAKEYSSALPDSLIAAIRLAVRCASNLKRD